MSRSKRKTSICGHTKAGSDKWYKQFRNRRERRKAKYLLKIGETLIPEKEIFPYDDWSAAKDGKQYFDEKKHPDLMRK